MRVGHLEKGDLKMAIAVSSSRWRDAMDAVEFASLELKETLPFSHVDPNSPSFLRLRCKWNNILESAAPLADSSAEQQQ